MKKPDRMEGSEGGVIEGNQIIAELNDRGYRIMRDGAIVGKRGNNRKFGLGSSGYYHFSIGRGKKQRTFSVHRLVAMAYIPNPENKAEVNHINGNKLDNRVENLEWVNRSENIKHGINTGLIQKSMVGRIGKKHWRSKPVIQYLNKEAVGEFDGTQDAARKTGLDATSIQDACNNKLKTYKGYTWKYK